MELEHNPYTLFMTSFLKCKHSTSLPETVNMFKGKYLNIKVNNTKFFVTLTKINQFFCDFREYLINF